MRSTWMVVVFLGMAGSIGRGAVAQAATEHHEMKPGVPSKELVVKANGKSTTLTLADLRAMPQISLKVHNGHSNQDETYTGVAMSALLAKFGLTLDGDGAKKVYHSYLRPEGTDKYFVIYSASELESSLTTWDSLVALTIDGKPLGDEGAFKIIAGGERKPARWVRNLSSLTIVTVE